LLAFKVHQFILKRRHYILLPKLTHGQMRALAVRLGKNGCSVQLSESLSAKSRGGVIHIDPSGLCWSLHDCSDEILPAIPEILSFPKDRSSLASLKSMYFRTARSGGQTVVRLSTRLESSTSWDVLRASGDCALAPDEHAIATFLIKRGCGSHSLVTDFPTEESVPRLCGRKRYFESTLGLAEAESTLRVAGKRAVRNSYLSRDGTLRSSGGFGYSLTDAKRLFEGLGEWCFFSPD
jgi:hypothetical protein